MFTIFTLLLFYCYRPIRHITFLCIKHTDTIATRGTNLATWQLNHIYTRHTSSCRCVGCVRSPESLT
ncbi:hypothetical protein DF213_16965 [Dickeya dianthicola]|uniref:Secreted protein n=1 Tax=Dickeya dianthicola TaxID=204039 RepID=A0AAX1C2S8_9GAMM|nr:hypothetical protein DF213_16965 [Dickeya dianthicola]